MISTLSLDIENKGDCKTIRVTDSSYYNPNLPVTCIRLGVKVPGSSTLVEFELEDKYFTLTLNANNLKIQNDVPSECLDYLPDGIYYIKYSINPNDKIYVEYNYLHNCAQKEKYIGFLCQLYEEKCNLTIKQYSEKLEELMHIKELMTSAKYLIEFCGNPEGGVCLYNEARDLLNKFNIYAFCKNC